MMQCDNEVSVRTLRAHMSHALRLDRTFQEIRVKMEEYIVNTSITVMIAPLTHLCVNTYFMSKACFGCGIVDITESWKN